MQTERDTEQHYIYEVVASHCSHFVPLSSRFLVVLWPILRLDLHLCGIFVLCGCFWGLYHP